MTLQGLLKHRHHLAYCVTVTGEIGHDIVTSSGREGNARRVSLQNDDLDNQRMLSKGSPETIKEANGGTADSTPNRQSEIDNQRSSDAVPFGTAWGTPSADKGLLYVGLHAGHKGT